MKILWIVNTLFPDLCIKLGVKPTVLGGWMYESAKELSRIENIDLTVVTTHQKEQIDSYDINGIKYFLIPSNNNETYNKSLEQEWQKIFTEIKPDIIHIHGTEYSHGLPSMSVFPKEKFVISIQGLVSVYARYFLGGISVAEIKTNKTLRDYLKGDLLKGQKQFESKGKLENLYLTQTKNVIGRTSWDFAHTKILNPQVNYHFCNETLRGVFYTASKWNIQNKKNHQIFLSQAATPIKGLHQVIKAVSLLKKEFPNIKIRVGGHDILKSTGSFSEKLKITDFGKYIKKLLHKYELQNNIQFLGLLSEEQMIEEYKQAHIFICPSSIENSPNSLGEAQILGVPVISSYVGGTKDMVVHKETGFLYRFEEVEMMAIYIKEIFNNDQLAQKLSHNGIVAATERHSLKQNINNLHEIYKTINSNL